MKKMLMVFGSIVFIVSIILLAVLPGAGVPGTGAEKKEPGAAEPPQAARPGSFVTMEELYKHLSSRPLSPVQEQKELQRVIGAVAPHHLVAGPLIAEALELAMQQSPSTVVLVGPNHKNRGARIITGWKDWQTPDGLAATDRETVQALLDKGLAVRDDEVLDVEHSVGTLVPFIKHFSPETRIVPLILHHDVSLQEIDRLLDAIAPCLKEDAVVVASVDFSHYLTRQEAEDRDVITLQSMKGFDYASLLRMGNDNLDSPASLSLVLRWAQRAGLQDFQVLRNTNSGIILKNDSIETTSYFTLLFGE